MGACVSRQRPSEMASSLRTSSSSNSSGTHKRSNKDLEESGVNPMVSMSFLRKYSFATVNPAFSDFETKHRNPEEEEATIRLRELAQESFGPWHGQQQQQQQQQQRNCSAPELKRSASSSDQQRDFADKFSEALRIEIEELGSSDQAITGKEEVKNSLRSRTTNHPIVEEKLVMSSSCMPSYSLGVVVNPEARIKNNSNRHRL